MSTFTKIAWRNITRNQYRSSLTISAVAIGLASLVFLKSFIDGADRQMVENYTSLLTGSIQIHRTGFQKNMGLEKSITEASFIFASLKNISGIKAAAPRIKDYALISSPESSAGILLYGIDPAAEKKLTTINQRLRRGRFLTKEDKDKIIIGKDLSDQMKTDLGDKVVLMSQGADGSLAASAYEICGILDAGVEDIDKNLALITIEAARDLLVLDGKISEIAIAAGSLNDNDEIARSIKAKIDTNKYEVLTWKEISPMTYQWIQFDQVFTGLILFIVLLVVAAGILNTILMSVLERTREFGIMLALGTKPQQVTSMVAAESLMLSGIGIIFGAALGSGLVVLLGITGIDLSAISSALNSFYIGSVIYPRLNIADLCVYAGIVLLTSVLVSIFPAKKAAKLSPIEAIRHI